MNFRLRRAACRTNYTLGAFKNGVRGRARTVYVRLEGQSARAALHSRTTCVEPIKWSPRLVSRQRLLVFSEALICLSYTAWGAPGSGGGNGASGRNCTCVRPLRSRMPYLLSHGSPEIGRAPRCCSGYLPPKAAKRDAPRGGISDPREASSSQAGRITVFLARGGLILFIGW